MALLTRSTTTLGITKGQARNALVGLRLTLAAGTWVAPNLVQRVFGLDPQDNPAAPYLLRLFGTRDGWMAVEVLSAGDQDAVLQSQIAVDVADAGAALIALGRPGMPKRAAVLAAAVAGAAAVLGFIASAED